MRGTVLVPQFQELDGQAVLPAHAEACDILCAQGTLDFEHACDGEVPEGEVEDEQQKHLPVRSGETRIRSACIPSPARA